MHFCVCVLWHCAKSRNVLQFAYLLATNQMPTKIFRWQGSIKSEFNSIQIRHVGSTHTQNKGALLRFVFEAQLQRTCPMLRSSKVSRLLGKSTCSKLCLKSWESHLICLVMEAGGQVTQDLWEKLLQFFHEYPDPWCSLRPRFNSKTQLLQTIWKPQMHPNLIRKMPEEHSAYSPRRGPKTLLMQPGKTTKA